MSQLNYKLDFQFIPSSAIHRDILFARAARYISFDKSCLNIYEGWLFHSSGVCLSYYKARNGWQEIDRKKTVTDKVTEKFYKFSQIKFVHHCLYRERRGSQSFVEGELCAANIDH